MSKDTVSAWDTVAANNEDVGGVELRENHMLPSNVNNAIRTMMAQIATGVGPATTVDNTVARYNGTTGKLQGSGVVVDDSNNVSGVGTLATGAITSTVAGNNQLILSAPSGSFGFYYMMTSGSTRWLFGRNGTAEGGTNSGSDFDLYRYDDAGAFLATVFRVTRATGLMNIFGSFGRSAPVTKTADFTVAAGENWLINNKSGSSCTVTLPAASSYSGREIMLKTIQAQTTVSASSNVIPLGGGAAGTAILSANAGRWATLVSNGTNWEIMAGVV